MSEKTNTNAACAACTTRTLLRLPIHPGTAPGPLATSEQIAAACGISANHLMKVVRLLLEFGA